MRDFGGAICHRSVSVAAAALIVALVLGLTYLAFRGHMSSNLVAVAIALPWLVVLLSVDSRRVSLGLAPIGIPILVLALPLAHLVFSGGLSEVFFQAGTVGLAAFYLSALGPAERRRALARAFPVALPFLILFCVFGLSYVLTPVLTRGDLYVVFNLVSASAYVVLAGVFCNSVQRVRRGIVLLIVAGAIQLPIVVAQASGIADRLPASLGLGTAGWGGPLVGRVTIGSARALARYPGSFGDVELLAEFSTVCVLLCLGLIMFRLRPPRSSILYALAGCAALVGWLTGTRSFLLGAVSGLLLLVAVALQQSGRRLARAGRAVLVMGLVGIVVAALVPSSVSSAYLDRFRSSELSQRGDFYNRGPLYRTAWGLVGEMPTLGYGANMMTVFDQSWGAPIPSPHSLYLTTLLTAGFLGLAGLAWLLLRLVAMPISCALRRRGGRTELRALGGILAVVMVAWVANEVKIEFLRHSFYVDLMAFLFGLVSSLFWFSRRSEHALLTVARRDSSSMEASGAR